MSRLSTSGPHRSSLRRRSRGALALLLALAVLALAVPSKAQAEVLVSNLNQLASTTAFNFGHSPTQNSLAQGFMTGASTGGYTLTSIEVAFNQGQSATQLGNLTVGVWSDDGSGNPSAELFTLIKPASIVGATESGGPITLSVTAPYTTFTAPANTTLNPSTPYHMVLEGGFRQLYSTAIDGETGAAGWSIADVGYKKETVPTPGNWEAVSDDHDASGAMLIRVNGAVATNTPPTAANKTVTAGVVYTFKAGDFGFADADTGDRLASVKIVTVPTPGTLALNGTAVVANAVVTKAQIDGGMLTFTPVAGAIGTGYASFTFKVNDGTDDSASAYTMTIDVTTCGAPNLAGRERIWTGKMTVGAGIDLGTTNFYGFDATYSTGFLVGALDHPTFNTGPNAYTVQNTLAVRENGFLHGDLQISPEG